MDVDVFFDSIAARDEVFHGRPEDVTGDFKGGHAARTFPIKPLRSAVGCKRHKSCIGPSFVNRDLNSVKPRAPGAFIGIVVVVFLDESEALRHTELDSAQGSAPCRNGLQGS